MIKTNNGIIIKITIVIHGLLFYNPLRLRQVTSHQRGKEGKNTDNRIKAGLAVSRARAGGGIATRGGSRRARVAWRAGRVGWVVLRGARVCAVL